jgi:hypothetical protein
VVEKRSMVEVKPAKYSHRSGAVERYDIFHVTSWIRIVVEEGILSRRTGLSVGDFHDYWSILCSIIYI